MTAWKSKAAPQRLIGGLYAGDLIVACPAFQPRQRVPTHRHSLGDVYVFESGVLAFVSANYREVDLYFAV